MAAFSAQPGIAPPSAGATCMPQQLSVQTKSHIPVLSPTQGLNPHFRDHLQAAMDSAGSSEPMRGRLKDLEKDYDIFKQRDFEVVDSLVSLQIPNPSPNIRRLTAGRRSFEEVLTALNQKSYEGMKSELSIW